MANLKKNGFTIVEIMIVLAVAGVILAMIFLAVPALQRTHRDTIRKNNLELVSAALLEYYTNHHNYVEATSGCGYGGTGNGWLNYSGGSYPDSIANCLSLSSEIRDPGGAPTGNQSSTPTSGYAYMKYSCTLSGVHSAFVYAKLEGLAQDTTSTDGTCCPTCDSLYGMNYYLKI